MSSYRWDELDPFTQRQIELQAWETGYGTNPQTLRTCGCEVMGEAWRLCQYHEGVDDGASEVRAEVERLTAELEAVREREWKEARRAEEAEVELAEMSQSRDWFADELAAAEAREAALRAITGKLRDDNLPDWCDCCDEWDRRAGEVT